MWANRVLRTVAAVVAVAVSQVAWSAEREAGQPAAKSTPTKCAVDRGLCLVLGLPETGGAAAVVDLARNSNLQIYFQSSREEEVAAVRRAASSAGLLGKKIFADRGEARALHLADNLADAASVLATAEKEADEAELLRVLRPQATAAIGGRSLVKPQPKGVDSWSHVWHGPDNNPLSADQLARAPYLTQFLAAPMFCPMPEVSVAAGGRVFRAFGHIAHKANQNALLNTLMGINGYNGTVLWQRALRPGFMIHRNTMIATPEVLYLGDEESCKVLDAQTGQLKDQIVIPAGLGDGPVWKWMALEKGVLYALVGGEEIKPATQPSNTPGLGHWPWGMWEGHDYKDPKTNFGFGRTFVAIDPATKKILWSHREEEFVDARGVCMRNGRIYYYGPRKFLACLNAASGKVAWKNSDRELLEAIGPDGKAQLWLTGYSTATFIKCNDRYLFLSGPQRSKLVVASTEDGRLVWQKTPGNLQIVLRDDGVYCAGQEGTGIGFKLSYDSGSQLGGVPSRRACTRATGTVDSIFYRAAEGTVRYDVPGQTAKHIALMRPPCQDGVIVSDGLLYWGPWMCGCALSLYGHVCLGPAGSFDFHPRPGDSRLSTAAGDVTKVAPLEVRSGDWPAYLGSATRGAVPLVDLPRQVTRKWSYALPGKSRPTAPVTAGGLVFVGDESGQVRALDAKSGEVRWTASTAGAIFFPPALWQGRLYAGSADGRVYAFEAATGRPLWHFRAAPADRWIPVYGKLMSTWPVAGGVVAADGVVYAAAGIAHYDGTYVYALDAVTGRMKWCNDSSGTLSEKVDSGVSLQGPLYLAEGELRFHGGGKHDVARYDLATGKCLNPPNDNLGSQFATAFYPYFPEYGRYTSLDRTLADGKRLVYNASYEGSQHSALTLLAPAPPGSQPAVKRDSRRPAERQRDAVWADKEGRRFHAFIVGRDVLLAAGHTAKNFLAAVDLAKGSDAWREDLPAATVPGGLAVDHDHMLIVALEDGQILAFGK
jgi:outer membrane protein assembly factor BamB